MSTTADRFPVLTRQQLKRPDLPPWRWLWHGYLASRRLTLLTSQWKTGKTTLASILLAHMKAGGQLAGLPVAPAKARTGESPDSTGAGHEDHDVYYNEETKAIHYNEEVIGYAD